MLTVNRSSELRADPDEVWRWVTTPHGVNDELRPWVRMTVPTAWAGSSIAEVPSGTRLGRSWLLVFGIVPFDFDDLCIAEVAPRRFLERSRLLSAPCWEHERTVVPTAHGCRLRDEVRLVPHRWVHAIGLARLQLRLVGAVFTHRHRRLRARFADEDAGRRGVR